MFNLFKKKEPKITITDFPMMPELPPELRSITIPTIKVIYSLSFDELPNIITKEVKLYDGLELARIPNKDDIINFGDELDRDCGFIVESVSRSQDKNEIMIIAKHYGHDSGLVYDQMISNHGFE